MMCTRRNFVCANGAVIACLSSAGCAFSSGTGRGVTDVVVHDTWKTTTAVEVIVTDLGDDEEVFEGTFNIPPNGRKTVNNKVVMGTTKRIKISVKSGPSETYEWEDAKSALHVILDGPENITFAIQVG